ELKDIEVVSYCELHIPLLNHDFTHGPSMLSLTVSGASYSASNQATNLNQKAFNLDRKYNSNGNRGRGRFSRG
ncbi:hypothetical protein HAX54_012650, partial [Datura stramonium]|nr:hypothetical protein [Datura stramonium]